MFIVKACSETALFRESSNQDFHSPQFRKYISYDNQLFFQNVKNLMYIREMVQKSQKIFFVFQIIASQLVVANSHNVEQDT